jgi:CHAT domain-containing protein/tetratricopeptide (TPR) repeat protein
MAVGSRRIPIRRSVTLGEMALHVLALVSVIGAARLHADDPRRVLATLETVSRPQDAQRRTDALQSGDQRQADLAAGQTHRYAIELESGHFLHAVVAPQGIDVAVLLVDPDGTEILDINLSLDQIASETIVAVAERPGRYQIIVRPAVGDVPPGRYLLAIEAVRRATPADVVHVDASRKLERGISLAQSNEPNQWEAALPWLADALAGFRQIDDRPNIARAIYQTAGAAHNLNRPEALDLARQALALYREIGNEVYVAASTTLIGFTHQRRGELAEASRLLTEALAMHQRRGNHSQAAATLNSLGIVYGRSGEPERAVEMFQRAEDIARVARLDRIQYASLNNLGIATKDLGDTRLALEYYERALALARTRRDRNGEAASLTNLGNLYRILGEYDKALAAHQASLLLAREVGNAEAEARALNTIGSTFYRLGEFQKALDHHRQSLEMRRRLVDFAAEAASLNGAGLAWHRLGNSEQALKDLMEALRIRRATSERIGEADTLRDLALVERDRGNMTAALGHIEAAVQLTDDMRGQVMSPDLRTSFIASEQDRYELYIDVLMQLHKDRPTGGFDVRAIEASERGRARVLLESLLEARSDIRQGVDADLLERERRSQTQLSEASARVSRLLTRQSEPREIDAARASLAALSTERRQLQDRIRRESPRYAALTQPSSMSVGDIQRELIDADTILLEYSLGETRSWLWAVTPTAVSSFELPPRREVEAAARRVYALLTARQSRPDESPRARSARMADADADWRWGSSILGRMLLGQAATHYADAWRGRRLLIVAADVLQFLPFSALSDPASEGQPLMVDHEIVSLPSASVLAAIRQQTDGLVPPQRQLAVFADPVFEADDPRITASAGSEVDGPHTATNRSIHAPAVSVAARALRSVDAMGDSRLPHLSRLPFTRLEASTISALVPADQRLQAIGFQASRTTVMTGDLSGYRILHFATHGFLNSEQPALSGLVLSLLDEDGQAQDGFLRLDDIYNLRLRADVVVLSACQTALGKDIRGEGVIGLTRGFMYAGARRVVASLWQVNDGATAELMKRFYQGMLIDRLTPAAALRRAQQQLAAIPRWASPYFWAPFVLQGDWK